MLKYVKFFKYANTLKTCIYMHYKLFSMHIICNAIMQYNETVFLYKKNDQK